MAKIRAEKAAEWLKDVKEIQQISIKLDSVLRDYNCLAFRYNPGSPLQINENAQHIIEYVLHYGRPDLFTTFICYPVMEDVDQLLLPEQSPGYRHDIAARIV
ncbi:hypothetical protein NPIL_424981 [Nephila pilipes]|uniref:Helitron helicase-like domain-containing protein n=1 Tax=Nephila pilipes TaxID=299642 RepID=A0A8X6MTZ1_NEPPI|nr:hypothetical protein NPIL_424981 [Nephila pilipes]